MRPYESDSSSNSNEPVSTSRLIEAADAILHAESVAGKGTVTMWRDDSKPVQDGFSAHELVEAMLFLRRLGMVDLENPKAARQRRSPWK